VLGGAAPARIAGEASRNRVLSELGIARIVTLVFDRDLAAVEAPEFVSELLERRLQARAAVFGEGFRFGARRAGSAASFAHSAVRPVEVAAVVDAGGPVSSTRVRAALAGADLDAAAALLGRRYEIEGPVVRGDRRGRTIGFPTANVDAGGADALAPGVYASVARLADGRTCRAALNVGVRPTVGGRTLTHEAHILGFDGDLYGQTLRLAPVLRLRAERTFPSLDDLRAQIARDVADARDALRGERPLDKAR
jgi:riboflavin kinase/FMN adenylyltransferase